MVLSCIAVGTLWIPLLVQRFKCIILMTTVGITTNNNNNVRKKHDNSKYAENMKLIWDINSSGLCQKYVWLTANKMALPVAF